GLAAAASATVTVGALAACDLDPSSSSDPAAHSTPDPDAQIVLAARAELRKLILDLSHTNGGAGRAAVPRVERAALQGHVPEAPAAGKALDRDQVVIREVRAARRFGRWALQADNGDLARVLASVAAGIRMQRAPRAAA